MADRKAAAHWQHDAGHQEPQTISMRTLELGEARLRSQLWQSGDKPVVDAETGNTNFVCPSCRTILIARLGEHHRYRLHDIAFRCSCGETLEVPPGTHWT